MDKTRITIHRPTKWSSYLPPLDFKPRETDERDEEYSPEDKSVNLSISLDDSEEETPLTINTQIKEAKQIEGEDNEQEQNEGENKDVEKAKEGKDEDEHESDEEIKTWKRKRYEEREGEFDEKCGEWKRITIELEERNKVKDLTGGIWNWNKKEYETKEEENAAVAEEWGRWRRRKTEELNVGEDGECGKKTKCKTKKLEEVEGGEWCVNINKTTESEKSDQDVSDGNKGEKQTANEKQDQNDSQDFFGTDDNQSSIICHRERVFRDKQYRNNWRKRKTEEIETEKDEDTKMDWKKSNIFTDEDNNSDNLEGKMKTWKRKETIINEDLYQAEFEGGELTKRKRQKIEEINLNESENFGTWRRWKIKYSHEMEERRVWKLK